MTGSPTGSVLLVALAVLTLGSCERADATEQPRPSADPIDDSFDRSAWQSDYRALKGELEHSYAHLAWFGSPEGGVDLPALDRATTEALGRAQTDADAAAAIQEFVAGFHDGHLLCGETPAPPDTASEPPAAELAADAPTACASYGYAPQTRVTFSLPFESLPHFTLVADGLADAFRAGVVAVGTTRIGVVRIPRFRAGEFPALCERVWASLQARGVEPTREAVADGANEEWLRTLATRLRQLRDRDVTTLLIDVGDNGGGNDLGDWAVRLFTSAPVHSSPMRMVSGPVAVPFFDVQLNGLRSALSEHADLPAPTRASVEQGIAAFEQRKRDAVGEPCDMSWVWTERRAWGTSDCTGLLDGGFASGYLDYAPPEALDSRAAPALYWASAADPFRGAWDGRTFVLTNPRTGSAAEAFVALLHDRGIARTIGRRTMGSGCGYVDMNLDEPYVLPHGHLAFNIPNCARLRGDGTDDVAGIAPDLPVLGEAGESWRSVAWRTLTTIADDE